MSLAFSWINLILSFLRLVEASWTLALLFSRSFAIVLWTTYTNMISYVGVEWLNPPCWSTGGELRISCLLFHNTPQHEHDDHWSACLWRCRLSLCSESQPGKYLLWSSENISLWSSENISSWSSENISLWLSENISVCTSDGAQYGNSTLLRYLWAPVMFWAAATKLFRAIIAMLYLHIPWLITYFYKLLFLQPFFKFRFVNAW